MRLLVLIVVPVTLLCGSIAQAHDPEYATSPGIDISLGTMTPTPEMWFYEQARKDYNDPRVAIRQRAAYEAQQRQLRIATRAWYGVSASRPTANPVPTHGPGYSVGYSTSWLDSNSWSYGGVIVLPRSHSGYRWW